MRIGTQNILFIGPLFLGLAVCLGLLLYYVESQRLLWGQQQEATGYAISIAEFTQERALDQHVTVADPAKDPGLRRALDRILGDGRIKTVFALDPKTAKLDWSYPAGALTTVPSDVTPDLDVILIDDGVWVSDIHRAAHKTGTLEAYSSMAAPDGKLVAAIGVVDDATGYVRATDRIGPETIGAAVAIFIIGLIIAGIVSYLISREVRSLSATAALISSGNLDVQASPGHIQEIGDLGNTFNTMSDVLKDVLSRTKRSLIEGEQFRTHAELAASYAGMFRPPVSEEVGGLHVAVSTSGQDFGLFWTAFETGGTVCIALGHLTAEDDVSTVIAASAATRYLKHRLTKDDAGDTISEIVDLFKPDFFECYCLTGGTVDHWTLTTADLDDEELPEGQRSSFSNVVRPAVQSYPADSRRLWTIHRFSPNADSIVNQYIRVFGHHGPDDLVHDILAALPTGTEGALLVAGIQRPAAATASSS